MSAVEEIRVKLETRLQEVEIEIESLRAGLDALEVQAAAEVQAAEAQTAAKSQPPTTKTKPRARRTAKRNGHTPATSRAELEQMLARAGGSDTVELARDIGADYGAVLARIRELEQAGRPRG